MHRRTAFLAALVFVLPGCFLSTEESPFLRLSSDVATQYNRRGMVMNEKGVLQSELDLGLATKVEGTLNVNLWTNVDLQNDTGRSWFSDGQGGRITQFDTTISYSETYRGVDVAYGISNYDFARGPSFPNGPRNGSIEAFASFGTDLGSVSKELSDLYPFLVVHYDFDEADDLYVEGGLSHGTALADDIFLSTDVQIGFSGSDHSYYAYGVRESGLADARATVTATYNQSPQVTLRARLGASTIIDGDIEDQFDAIGIESDNAWLSLGLDWSP